MSALKQESSMRTCGTALCSLLLIVTLAPNFAFSQNLKFTEHDTTAGGGPIQLVRADFNNDTIPDLAVLNRDSKTISVFILNGDGTFRSHVDVSIGFTPTGIAVGDFNHDHFVDIVTSNQDPDEGKTHTLALFLGNGDGTFKDPKLVYGGSDPTSIAVGDFNNDGNLDAVTIYNSPPINDTQNFIQILITVGDGKGGFKSQVAIGVIEDVQPGERPRQASKLAVADFDHNGWLDIAFTEVGGGFDVELGDVMVVSNKGNNQYDSAKVADISVPVGMATADINQDGFDDLLVSFSGCHTPCLGVEYLRNDAGKSFKQVPVAEFPDSQFGIPYGPSAGDVNGDGLKDIVTAVSNIETNRIQLAVSLQKADGTFSSPPTFIDTNRTGPNFASTVTADLTKDGRMDMALSAEDGLATLIQTTPIRGCPAPSSSRSLKVCLPLYLAGSSPMQVLASTRDPLPIEAIKVYVDGVAKFTTTDDLLSGRLSLPLGKHQILVKAWDRLGSFTAPAFSFNTLTGCGLYPGTDRTVRICAPLEGATVTQPVHVEAAVTDSGQLLNIQIYVDGVLRTNISPNTAFDSSLTNIPSGNHRITVKGWDAAGQFSQTVNFTVQ
jgi:hypothetical protein